MLFRSGKGWVNLSHKSIISISGEDRLSWLQAITTQDFENVTQDVWSGALILDAQGHISHQFIFMEDGESVWIVTEKDKEAELIAYLEKMKFMFRVEIKNKSGEFALVRTPGQPDEFGGPFKLFSRGEFESFRNQILKDYKEVGIWALEAERVAAGRARILFETDHKAIPNELGMLGREVNMNKGCYPGQETVAKINNLGQPPRRLTLLHLDGSAVEMPGLGEKVFDGDKEVGFLGTSIRHHELGPIALAVIKRSVPISNTLIVKGVSANQEPISST